jgi:hypothetical protein
VVAGANKLTLGQEITIRALHSILILMEYKGNYWLTNSQMVKYQTMLCENPHIQLEIVKTLNLTNLLPADLGPLEHDCLEVMDEVFLKPAKSAYRPSGCGIFHRWQDSIHFAGYVVVTTDSVIEAHQLPIGTSAQKAELVPLSQVLQLATGV